LAAGGLAVASEQSRGNPTALFGEVDVPEEGRQSELQAGEEAQGGELEVPQDAQLQELEVQQQDAVFQTELSAEDTGQVEEVPIPSSVGEEPSGQVRSGETVVPADFPLAGRDLPADPSREFVSGERRTPPTAEASPTGALRPGEEEEQPQEPEELEEEEGLGVPTDDPFRRSDRRLFDPRREFGEQEDVASIPDETTPREINDIGEGIAGEGAAIEPARGETVEENFQLFLEERQERQEQAERREVLADERAEPTGEPRGRVQKAQEDSVFQQEDSLMLERELGRGLDGLGQAGDAGGLFAGVFGRLDAVERPSTRGAQDADPDADADVGTDPFTAPARGSEPVVGNIESQDVRVEPMESVGELAQETRAPLESSQRNQVGNQLITFTENVELTTPFGPDVPSISGRDRPGAGEQDDEGDLALEREFGIGAQQFVNPVASAEDFFGTQEGGR
jgi:hypothetical protein